MTAEDEQDLRELQAELVSAEQSPWQPRCVARAFRSAAPEEPFVFTMQTWIELDAVQSPFLHGRLPEAEDELWAKFEEAFAAFGFDGTTPEKCSGEDLVLIGRKIIRAITHGFSTKLELVPLERSRQSPENGLGGWLPVMACLKAQLGFLWAEAKALPVAQAYALIAAHRCNEGREVAGETYALRDVDPTSPDLQDSDVTREGD
jgi:hypothetical protein